MKVKEFVAKHNLRGAVTAGLLDHLRIEAETDVPDERIHAAYKAVFGVSLATTETEVSSAAPVETATGDQADVAADRSSRRRPGVSRTDDTQP